MSIIYKSYKDADGEVYSYREGSTQDIAASNDPSLIRTQGGDRVVSNDETIDETPVNVSQINNFNQEVKNQETVTSLSIIGNTLRYTNENNVDTDIDLSVYLDDTNAAFIASGTLSNGIITFTRDDNSTFDVDVSTLLDNQNASEVPFTPTGNIDSTNVQDAIEENRLEIENLINNISDDHGDLLGLADDDHPQYLNEARGDSRYYTETELDNGQLDNRYYTESELNSGQLDSRYYTESEVDTLVTNLQNQVTVNTDDIIDIETINTTQQTQIDQNTTNNTGSISVHSDVNLDGISSGDYIVFDNGELKPKGVNFGFTLFNCYFEENGDIANNQYEWSMGNGSTGSRIGYIVPENCEIYQMAINVDSATVGTSASINLRRASAGTTDINNSPIIATPLFTSNNQIQPITPIQLNKGDIIVPQTNTVIGTWSDVRIFLYFRIIASADSAKTDIKQVTASNIAFTSTTFANIPTLTSTITLTRAGNLIGDLIYSAARSGVANAATQFRVVINGDNGQAYSDTLSTFNDTGSATHFLENVPAGTYTISAQAVVDNPILIASAGLKLTAREQ